MKFIRLVVCMGGMWILSTGFTGGMRDTCIDQTTVCGGDGCPDISDCPDPGELGCHVCATQCNAADCIACNETTTDHPCDAT